jgi:hypothetical protein
VREHRGAGVLCVTLGLLWAARVSAHDPFEITSDAHVDASGLNVHTTLSLDTAVRLCLAAAAPARRLVRGDFEQFRAPLAGCARDYYLITSGRERLAVRSLSLQLSPEDDLEVRAVHARPIESPLSFDAQGLKGLPEHGGVVLTVTGQRSFLGQKVLRPGDMRLELPITSEGEAIGAPAPAAPDPAPAGEGERRGLWFLLALLMGIAAFVLVRKRR